MSHKYKITQLVGLLLLWFFMGCFASAKPIDPCGYGCPKDGCSQCPTGGPIGAKAEQAKAGNNHNSNKVKVKHDHQKKQLPQGAPNPLRKVSSMSCSACEAERRACFANCNEPGPVVVGGQVECVKQCQRSYPCIPNRDCD